ncbi:MAG: chondroitinase family polysaccharide lyase [Bacteroidaceae bacterium]
MNRHLSFLLLLLLLTPWQPVHADTLFSFEEGVPAGWAVSKGVLSRSAEKAKLGQSSLCWQWKGGDLLTATDQQIALTSKANRGGIRFWIYNTVASNQDLVLSFHLSTGEVRKCSLPIHLDFQGWRCVWAEYVADMKLAQANKGKITAMQFKAPSSGSGTLYLDFLEFTSTVSWEKMSDFQYTVTESAGIDGYLDARNVPVPPATSPTPAQQAAFTEIENRLEQWYLGSTLHEADETYLLRKQAVSSYLAAGTAREYTLNANGTLRLNTGSTSKPVYKESGLLPFDHYHNQTIDGQAVVSSRDVGEGLLIQLAYDYRLHGTQASRDKALELLRWYADQGWADGSALGTLRFEMLRSAGFYHAAFLLRHEMDDDLYAHLSAACRWYTRFGDAYQTPDVPGELADYVRALAVPKLFYALSLTDGGQRTTALNAFRTYMDNALSHAPGYLGSLKPDGSGYHHRGAYYSAYYPQVLYVGCFLYYILRDTPFALSEASYQNLKQALLSFRFLCADYNIPAGTAGRFPHQTEMLYKLAPAFAYLALSRDDAELTAAYKRIWRPDDPLVRTYLAKASTDITFCSTLGEAEVLLEASALPGEAEANPTGTVFMPYSGLLVTRRADWVVTVKGFSRYIWDYESSGTENVYGRYLSYGTMEFSDLTNGNRSYRLTAADTKQNTPWDWRHLPGTTAPFVSEEQLHYASVQKHRNFSDEAHLGGLNLDERYGMFSNRLHDREITGTFRADKSVFVLDDLFYCLGSRITGTADAPSCHTTLFQNPIPAGDESITADGLPVADGTVSSANPLVCDNYGNAYLVDGPVRFSRNDAYCTAYIDHGPSLQSPQSYRYAWFVQPADRSRTALEQRLNDIRVLRQDASAHALWDEQQQVLAASLFGAGTNLAIDCLHSASLPSLVMVRKQADGGCEVAFSNPDLNRPSATSNDELDADKVKEPGQAQTYSLILKGNYEKADGDASVLVETAGGYTTLTHPATCDGLTYRVRLQPLGTSTLASVPDEALRIRTADGVCHIDAPEGKTYQWQLTDAGGCLLAAGQATGSLALPLPKPKGLYLLRLHTAQENVIYKLIQ